MDGIEAVDAINKMVDNIPVKLRSEISIILSVKIAQALHDYVIDVPNYVMKSGYKFKWREVNCIVA